MSWIPPEPRETDPLEETDDPEFDQTPVRCICSNCGGSIITFIDFQPSWVTFAMAIFVLFACGWVSLCIIPILWPVFKDVVHHCPRCLNILAKRSRVQITSGGSDVMTVRLGSCAMVLSRKYLLFFLALVGFILLIRTVRSSLSVDDVLTMRQNIVTSIPWEDFRKDCGSNVQLGNPLHVHSAYDHKYRNRTVSWTGEVSRMDLGTNLFFWTTTSIVQVVMTRDEPRYRGGSDLSLVFPTHEGEKIGVTKVRKNDQARFVATFANSLPTRGLATLRLFSIERIESDEPSD